MSFAGLRAALRMYAEVVVEVTASQDEDPKCQGALLDENSPSWRWVETLLHKNSEMCHLFHPVHAAAINPTC